jgi:hypothetical protein
MPHVFVELWLPSYSVISSFLHFMFRRSVRCIQLGRQTGQPKELRGARQGRFDVTMVVRVREPLACEGRAHSGALRRVVLRATIQDVEG